MGIFDDQIQFLMDLKDRIIFEVLENTFNQFGFVVKDFVVNKQLFREGIDGKGVQLEGYARSTIRIKITKQQPVDRTTLHDTQRFVDSITVEAYPDRFEVTSNIAYDKYIIERYGIDVLAPTTENLTEFLENFYLPELKRRTEQELKN